MNVNLSEDQTKDPIKGNNTESSLYDPNKLISISVQAKILSWVTLVISIVFLAAATINFVTEFFSGYNYGYSPDFGDFAFFVASFFPALIGLFLYVILRFVAEGIYLFMDIEINSRERNEKQK